MATMEDRVQQMCEEQTNCKACTAFEGTCSWDPEGTAKCSMIDKSISPSLGELTNPRMCEKTATDAPVTRPPTKADVTIRWGFETSKEDSFQTIKQGDTVAWIMDLGGKHNVVSTDDNGRLIQDGELRSRLLPVGEENVYMHTFNQIGAFPYVCSPHASFMKGAIKVLPATRPCGEADCNPIKCERGFESFVPKGECCPECRPLKTTTPEPMACPRDVRECRDGSFVTRDPKLDCEFPECKS
eukprot:gene16604-24143_t